MHYHSFLFSVMCKCSYLNEEDLKNKKHKLILPSSTSSSQVTTPKNNLISSPSSSRKVSSTTFFSSPRSSRRSRDLESRSTAKDEGRRSGGTAPRLLLPPRIKGRKLKRKVTIGSTLSDSSGSGDVEEPDWPPFADEDYIVFCFEEDGAFHVVMEESPKNNNCQKAEEESSSSQLSPRLLIDVGDHLMVNNNLTLENESTESMECRNGSVETTDSSQLDDDDNDDDDERFENDDDYQVDENDRTSSPKSEMTVRFSIEELLKGDNEVSSIESDQSSGFGESNSRGDHKDQLEMNEELSLESPKSSISRQSNDSRGSFKFPVLEWEWMGSPVKWPRPEKAHYRRQKARPTCLRCCKF